MIDQSNINLLNIIPTDLKKVGATGGGEYHGACPFCGGKDRFIVQPNSGNGGHWWCRQCGKSGDPIAFLMQYDNLDFKSACEQLGATLGDPPRKKRPELKPELPVSDLKEDYACFDDAWQEAAADFAYACGGELWDNWHTPAGQYLEQRGIDRDTAVAECIGLNPREYRGKWGSVDVWLPRGITIPWQIHKRWWNIRVRRPNADLKAGGDKYISAKGAANGLYGAYSIAPGSTIIMTEGEFDRLVIMRYLRQRRIQGVGAVSIGSCTGARVLRWVTMLSLCERVYVAFDNDAAGDQAAAYWQAALHPKARRLRPTKKDITEDWQAGLLAGLLEGIG